MSQAVKYLESVSYKELADDDFDNDTLETVTINEAIIACKIQELETLKKIKQNFIKETLEPRIKHLEKELRNIKIK